MSNIISKELLSQILGYEVIDVMNEILTNNNLFYTTNNSSISKQFSPYIPSINIYELAHKCKVWAVNLSPNKHALSSYPRWGDIRNYKKTNGSYYICQHLVSGAQFEAETEPEAIFKACQWILTKDSK